MMGVGGLDVSHVKSHLQDEVGSAAIKTVELVAALGGRAVQYLEVQGHEIEKFLSYFKPCIIPQDGGVASVFKHPVAEEHQTRLFVCKGKDVVHVKEAVGEISKASRNEASGMHHEAKPFCTHIKSVLSEINIVSSNHF